MPPLLSAVVAVQCSLVFALSARAAAPDGVTTAEPDRAPAAADRAVAREPSESNEDDEYNFSWLDPDKKVYVLQNRKYRKKGRFAMFLSGDLNLSNPYRTEYGLIPRASYWFSEQFGIEFFYGSLNNSDNKTLTALKNASPTALPFVREIRNYYGGAVTWTPWYSKLNFFNKILYFDWYFLFGLGQVNTAVDQNTRADQASNFVTENIFAVYFGTGQNFYVTRNFLVRLDLIGMMYSATGADNKSKNNTTNFDFAAGIGYAF